MYELGHGLHRSVNKDVPQTQRIAASLLDCCQPALMAVQKLVRPVAKGSGPRSFGGVLSRWRAEAAWLERSKWPGREGLVATPDLLQGIQGRGAKPVSASRHMI